MFVYYDIDKVYQEFEDITPEIIDTLKEWMETQQHLPQLNDLILAFFYKGANYNLDEAKQLIDICLTVKTLFPEMFGNRAEYTENFYQALKTGLATFLPGKTEDDSKIFYTKLMDSDPAKFNQLENIRLNNMAGEVQYCMEGPAKHSILIVDLGDYSMQHFFKCSYALTKAHLFYAQEAMALNIKSMHFINSASYVDKFLIFLKPLLKKELFNAIKVHTYPNTTLYEYVPKKLLPNELGGEAGTFKELHEKMIKTMEENRDYFVEEDKMRVDETKRVGKPTVTRGLFGLKKHC